MHDTPTVSLNLIRLALASSALLITVFAEPIFADSAFQPGLGCLTAPLRKLALRSWQSEPRSKNWNELPLISTDSFAIPFKKLLSNHPAVRDLQSEHGRGSKLHFFIRHYEADIDSGKTASVTGEHLQAVFLKRLLNTVLPEAKFSNAANAPHQPKDVDSARKAIRLSIQDSAEAGHFVDWRSAGRQSAGPMIEMSLLKAANPGPTVKTKSDLRSKMNLPSQEKIVSVYSSVNTPLPTLNLALKTFIETSNAKVLILTTPWITEAAHYFSKLPNVRVLSSKNVEPNLRSDSGKIVILNETRERMPAIHAASDATIVFGSPNLFESLNVGTPTIYFRTAEEGFNQKTWEMLAENAQATGGAKGINTIDEAIVLINTNSISKPSRPALAIQDESKTSPLDRLLTNLTNAMKNQ